MVQEVKYDKIIFRAYKMESSKPILKAEKELLKKKQDPRDFYLLEIPTSQSKEYGNQKRIFFYSILN